MINHITTVPILCISCVFIYVTLIDNKYFNNTLFSYFNKLNSYHHITKRRNLRNTGIIKVDYGYQDDKILTNITLFSSMIVHDELSLTNSLHHEKLYLKHHLDLLLKNSSIINSHIGYHELIKTIIKRRRLTMKLISKLFDPIKFQKWPCIHSKSCPSKSNNLIIDNEDNAIIPNTNKMITLKLNQSLYQHYLININKYGLNHLQIWLEFIFFDHDIINANKRKVPEYITSNDYSSVSGVFSSYSNGTFYKNNRLFLDDDILLVLEDYIEVNPGWNEHQMLNYYRHHMNEHIYNNNITNNNANINNNSNTTDNSINNEITISEIIRWELYKMSTDILILGWEKYNNIQQQPSDIIPITAQDKQYITNSIDFPQKLQTSILHNNHTTTTSTTNHNNIPMFAYAITRRGARKLNKLFDHCNKLLDLGNQLYLFEQHNLITYSYSHYSIFVSHDNILE